MNLAKIQRRVLVGALAAIGAATLAGCPPFPPCGRDGLAVVRISFHDFESGCGNDTCGLAVVSGQVSRTSTFTTGEHALQLEAGAVLARSSTLQLTGEGESVAMLARCDEGTSLRVEEILVLTRRGAGGAESVRETVTNAVELQPGTAWQGASGSFANHGAPDTRVAIGEDAGRGTGRDAGSDAGTTALDPPLSAQLTSFRVMVVGGGSCSVDNVEFSQRVRAVCGL